MVVIIIRVVFLKLNNKKVSDRKEVKAMAKQEKKDKKKLVLKVTKVIIKTTSTNGSIHAPGPECGESPL